MSLILDALKKIEREKADAGEPGVVVLGSVPWGEPGARQRRGRLAAGALLALGLVALGAWWLIGRTPGAIAPAAPAARALADDPAPPNVVVPPATAPPLPAPLPAARSLVSPAPSLRESPGSPGGRPASETTAEAPAEPAPAELAAEPGPARTAGPPPLPELRLAAISARDGQPVAIVNDRLVREGDSFDGVRVVRIGEAEVEVEFRGRRHVLRF